MLHLTVATKSSLDSVKLKLHPFSSTVRTLASVSLVTVTWIVQWRGMELIKSFNATTGRRDVPDSLLTVSC